MGIVPQTRTAEWILGVLCPTFCCLAVGLIAQGVGVLTPQSGFFQLGVNAVIVGVLVTVARHCPAGRYLAVGLLISIAMIVVTVQSGLRIVLHTALLMAMWVGVVLLNVKILDRHRWVQAVGRYVVWSLVFAAGLLGTGAVLIALFRPSDAASSVVFYVKLSVLTGVGLGMGFKAQDWLWTGLHRESTGPTSR